jgi:UDP-glucuronate decarboxylase
MNLGNPNEFTMVELAELVSELVGHRSAVEYRPLPHDDPKQRRPDISRAEKLIDFVPSVPLRTGLQRTMENFKERLDVVSSRVATRAAG